MAANNSILARLLGNGNKQFQEYLTQSKAQAPTELSYQVGDQSKTMPWGDQQEQEFQGAMKTQSPYADWGQQFKAKYGEPPNLNDSSYNYRLAYALGAKPQEYSHDPGMMHWGSATEVPPYQDAASLKGPNHPTLWMEHFMQRYGSDPHEASAEQLQDGIRNGIIPMRRPPE